MIYKTESCNYVISSNDQWISGVYDSERTATYAFKFPYEQLMRLQENKNRTSKVITLDDLKSLFQNLKKRFLY